MSEAIKILRDIQAHFVPYCELSQAYFINPETQYGQLIKAIAELEKEQAENERLKEESRWIPVSERLPEKTGEYLVFPSQKHCLTLWYQDGWYWYSHQDDAIQDTIGYCEDPILEVTHWKPIILPAKALQGGGRTDKGLDTESD